MRKVPCCKGFHTLWFVSGENKRHRSVHPDALIFTLFILRRYCRDPRPMNFAFFHTKGATGLLLTSPQRSDPGPRWGQKESEPTQHQPSQFARNSIIQMYFSHSSSFKRSPVYRTFVLSYSTKKQRTSSSNRFACGHFTPHHSNEHGQFQYIFLSKDCKYK